MTFAERPLGKLIDFQERAAHLRTNRVINHIHNMDLFPVLDFSELGERLPDIKSSIQQARATLLPFDGDTMDAKIVNAWRFAENLADTTGTRAAVFRAQQKARTAVDARTRFSDIQLTDREAVGLFDMNAQRAAGWEELSVAIYENEESPTVQNPFSLFLKLYALGARTVGTNATGSKLRVQFIVKNVPNPHTRYSGLHLASYTERSSNLEFKSML